jgi:hypothetical protein
MNSPQQTHEVRLRGLEDVGFGDEVVHVVMHPVDAARRAVPARAGEALFVPRLGARQGFPLSQRRL